MEKRFWGLMIVMAVLWGSVHGQYCTSDARYTEQSFFDSLEITVGTNVQYGIAQDYLGNPDTLRMDLYYPSLGIDPSPKRPFILMFHGGGFVSGDKQSGDIRDVCFHLARRGFIAASVNYRLGYDFSEYGQYKARYRAIQDGHAAMRFLVNNAGAVRADTNWLFVGGQSAGSLLALGMVYADQDELDSISLLYGSTSASSELGDLYTSGNNLTHTYSIKGVFNNWGGAVASEMDQDEMVPTIAFHGGQDTVVQIDADNTFLHYTLNGSRAIHQELTAEGICSELIVDTLGGHGIYRNASSNFRVQKASCFFKSVFCGNCSSGYSTDSIAPTCSLPLRITPPESVSDIRVYPNPFNDSFEIDGVDGMFEVVIYNELGAAVWKKEMLNGAVQIDLMPGIYLVRIKQLGSDNVTFARMIRE